MAVTLRDTAKNTTMCAKRIPALCTPSTFVAFSASIPFLYTTGDSCSIRDITNLLRLIKNTSGTPEMRLQKLDNMSETTTSTAHRKWKEHISRCAVYPTCQAARRRPKKLPLPMPVTNRIWDEIAFTRLVDQYIHWGSRQWNISPGALLHAQLLSATTENSRWHTRAGSGDACQKDGWQGKKAACGLLVVKTKSNPKNHLDYSLS